MHRSTLGGTRIRAVALVWIALLCSAAPAWAIPALQLYIEGATYESADETWSVNSNEFTLWAIADVKSYGPIYDVKLTAAFPHGIPGTMNLIPARADSAYLPSPDDPSISVAPWLAANPSSALTSSGPCGSHGTVGTIPCLGSGAPLPTHGEYGPGVDWVEFSLGNMTLKDSRIGDYSESIPDPNITSQFPSLGQINAYYVQLSDFPEGTVVHFDAFNHIAASRKGKTTYKFAPFSHDAGGGQVPEPSSWLLLIGASAYFVRRVLHGRRSPSAR